MPRPQTPSDLSDLVDRDLNWRVREISDLRGAADRADAQLCGAIVRGGVTLLYAHWEGHIRFVAERYLEFLTIRKLRFRELKPAFRLGQFHRYFVPGAIPTTYAGRLSLLSEVSGSANERFSQVNRDLVGTRSNLSTGVLADICCALSIDPEEFSSASDFIDKILLHKRNGIAHGEQVTIGLSDFRDMSDRVIELMRRFKNIVENDVTLQGYRVGPAVEVARAGRTGNPL